MTVQKPSNTMVQFIRRDRACLWLSIVYRLGSNKRLESTAPRSPTEGAALLSDGNRLTRTKNCLLLCVPWSYSSLQRRGAEVSVADPTPGNTLRSPPFFTNPLGPGGTLTSAALPASA